MRKQITNCLLVCLALSTGNAYADIVLTFSTDGGLTFGDEFEVQTGESLSLGIYLQQTSPDTVLTSEGLVSWGLDLERSPTKFGVIANTTINPAFDVENHNVTTATGFEWEFAQSASTGITGDSILLGSFDFDTLQDGITSFAVSDRLPGTGFENASWYTPTLNSLDEPIFGADAANSFQFSISSVTSVPEPSSAAILSVLSVLAIFRRGRRVY